MTPISSTTILNDIKHAPAFAEEIVKVLDVDTLLDTTAARLVWSIAIEPGDQIAGALTAALGPIAALEILLKSASEKGFLQNLLQELRRTETVKRPGSVGGSVVTDGEWSHGPTQEQGTPLLR